MAEKFRPERPNPKERLRSTAERRRKFFDKLTGSPWSWAAAAVMALESQGCATMTQAMGIATLEPRSSGMSYNAGMGASGSFVGPTLEVHSLPERARAGITNLPEGFYTPDLAERLHQARARGGKQPDVPRGYIDLESLGFERADGAFVIVQENFSGRPRSAAARNVLIAQETGRGLSLMSALPQRLDSGVRMEWVEVTRYGGQEIVSPPPPKSVEEHAANIATVGSHENMGGETRTTLSCRMTVLDGTFQDAAKPQRREKGHALEFDVLQGKTDLRPLSLVFSQEKSVTYPERPAQAALSTDYEPISDLTTLYTAYEILTHQQDNLTKRMNAIELRLKQPSLQNEEKQKLEAQYAKLSSQLSDLRISPEYRQTKDRSEKEIARLQAELASLQEKPLPAKERYDVNDLREGAAQKKWREKHIPELESQIAALQKEMAAELARLTPTSLDPLTKKLSGLVEAAKRKLTTAALGALGQNIGTRTEVRILTDFDATRGAIRLVFILDNPKQ